MTRGIVTRLLLLLLLASPVLAQRIVIITGGTVTANVTDSADFYVTLNQNVTGVTLTSTVTPATGYIVSMKFVQDATGSRTVAFGGTISTSCSVNSTALSVTICRWQYTASTNLWTDAAGGGVSAVAALPATCTPGVTSPVQLSVAPFGIYYCAGTNIWAPDGGSLTPPITFDATAYGVQGNTGQACMDGNVTSASPTVTTLGSCTFHCPGSVYPCSTAGVAGTDVGKQIFVTSLCSATGCGPYYYMTSKNILGATQQTLVTISSIQSATSLTASDNAAVTCSVATGTANVCAVVIAVDYTTQLNNMYVAGMATAAPGCPRFQLPQGIIGFKAPLFKTNGSLNQCSINGGTAGHIQQLGIIGPTIVGTGPMSTILVPFPDYNFGAACGTANVGSGNGLSWIDVGISGFGQSFVGLSLTPTCGTLVGSSAAYYHNVNFTGWCTRCNGSTGVSLTAYSVMDDSYVSGFGSTGGSVNASGSFIQILNNSIGGYQSLLTSSGTVSSSGNQFYGPSFANLPAIEVQSGTLISVGDVDQTLGPSGQTAGTPIVQVDNTGTLYSSNFVATSGGANFGGLKINATGKAYVFGWNAIGAQTNAGLNNAGTFFDQCGNTFNGPVSGAGKFFGSCSITGTTITAGNLVLSAGWGASAAWTSLTGSTQAIQGTITNTGAGQAANPTITYTFPTPFYAAPAFCSAYQVGGTQAILATTEFLTPSALSATSVTFTYNGTPTVNLTEVIQILCTNQ